MAIEWAIRSYPYLQYTGDNVDEMQQFVFDFGGDPDATVTTSVVGETLSITVASDMNGPGLYLLTIGDRLSVTQGVIPESMWTTEYLVR